MAWALMTHTTAAARIMKIRTKQIGRNVTAQQFQFPLLKPSRKTKLTSVSFAL